MRLLAPTQNHSQLNDEISLLFKTGNISAVGVMVGVQATPTIPHPLCTSAFHPYDGRRLGVFVFMPVEDKYY